DLEVDDAGHRDEERRQADGVRLEPADGGRVETLDTGHTVRIRALFDPGEAGELGLVERDDQLSDALVRDALLVAVGVHGTRARDAEARLRASRRVVDAGVDDAAVVPALMCRDALLLLEDGDASRRVTPQELAGRGEADDPAADDADVERATGRWR